MKLLSNEQADEISNICQELLEVKGPGEVYKFAVFRDLDYTYCRFCHADTPDIPRATGLECALCGQDKGYL